MLPKNICIDKLKGTEPTTEDKHKLENAVNDLLSNTQQRRGKQ